MRALILSGGGVKGIALLGALDELSNNINLGEIPILIGSSIGGLICFLISINYNIKDIIEINNSIQWSKFQDVNFDNLLESWSLTSFDGIYDLIKNVIISKGLNPDITFRQHYNLFKKDLIITGTNLTMRRTEYFNYDSTPSMSILKAIQITMNYPFMFPAIKLNNCYYIDGGVLQPYPVEYCDHIPDNEKIGIYLGEDYFDSTTHEKNMSNINSIFDYGLNIINMIYNKYCGYNLNKYKKITCIINFKGVDSMDFSITSEIKNNLYLVGKSSMKDFLAGNRDDST